MTPESSSRLPPLARPVIEARRRGLPVNVFVYCGRNCWSLARARQHAIAVPTAQDGRLVNWRPIVGGLPGVMLVARGWSESELDALARQLVRDGARLVTALRVEPAGKVSRVLPAFYRPQRRAVA